MKNHQESRLERQLLTQIIESRIPKSIKELLEILSKE